METNPEVSDGGAPRLSLSVKGLRVSLRDERGWVPIVNDVSFGVAPGECLAVVGESGSGKTMTFMAILGLIDQEHRVEGEAVFRGVNVLAQTGRARADIRGRGIGMVFQDPSSSLNPVRTIGAQVVEVLRLRLGMDRRSAKQRAVELLNMVELPEPDRRFGEYPHQLSGGMRQRVVIAMALAGEPEVLIADECTTALDVTIQQQIVDLILRLKDEYALAVVWITHDLGVVSQVADRVQVMYSGEILETASVHQIINDARHPYTRALMRCHPRLEPFTSIDSLKHIPGQPPDPASRPTGCVFWPRCDQRSDARCESERPELREVEPGHFVASFYTARL